jgi:hypothetical protein
MTTIAKNIEVQIGWNSYNDRRYGKPWAAILTWAEGAGSATYDFQRGAYCGDASGGEIIISAPAGTVVSYGQKDHRSRYSEHYIGVIKDDGDIEAMTAAKARKHYFENKAKQ